MSRSHRGGRYYETDSLSDECEGLLKQEWSTPLKTAPGLTTNEGTRCSGTRCSGTRCGPSPLQQRLRCLACGASSCLACERHRWSLTDNVTRPYTWLREARFQVLARIRSRWATNSFSCKRIFNGEGVLPASKRKAGRWSSSMQ